MQERMNNAPLFVKVEDYKGILGILEDLKDKLTEAKSTLERLQEIRKEEDNEFAQWSTTLDEIEKRMDNIDQELLEPEGM